MIPNKSSPCWRKIATGEKKIQTTQLGLQMLLKRINGKINPKSPDGEQQAAADELHDFFVKYERILSAEISGLGS